METSPFLPFSLAKIERKAPQAIAADIAEKIDASHFEKVVATGPYVNFFLDKSQISDQVIKSVIEAGADYGQQDEGHGGNITIDLSSPNIAKPFLSWSFALNRYRRCSFKYLPQNGLQHH